MLASLLPELTDRAEPLNEPLTRAIHAISATIPHAVTGDRRALHLQRRNPLGLRYFHAIVVEFLERGLASLPPTASWLGA